MNIGYDFACFAVEHAAKCGEKYEQNLSLLSDLAVLVTEHKPTIEKNPQLKDACEALIELLVDKDKEELVKDIDVIRNNLTKV